jgi:hypothetical protein
MTQEEAIKFLNEAFKAFPGPREWLWDRAKDPDATFDVWAGVLTKIELSDARRVIAGWLDGSIEMFTWSDKEAWATVIVSRAKELRRTSDRVEETRALIDEIIEPGTRREPYQPMLAQFLALRSQAVTDLAAKMQAPRVQPVKLDARIMEEDNRRHILNYLQHVRNG